MSKKILIDASHSEETRVILLNEELVEDFDFASISKKQIKGNIYLAKVTRIEPSLQAAFVEYGNDKQGFLPFSEIHPDYYQIPQADRIALMEEINRSVKEEDSEDIASQDLEGAENYNAEEAVQENLEANDNEEEGITEMGDDLPKPKKIHYLRRYKIQEVIKKGQVVLIQVLKEERGNKGAAVTSYISLAGRYCVLMPNSTSGGGISRKISSSEDRRRLKDLISSLELGQGMSIIVRTAGLDRSKPEIRRDYDYLVKLWNEIRDLTLSSTAPALIYEENDIIRRAIRDLYDADSDEVLVDGEEAFKIAKAYMKKMMPSHTARVKLYKDEGMLLTNYGVEQQLLEITSPQISLPSGGYLIFSPTEALVAIDVNSGRATREKSIEDTATKTNLEAAREIARQLRLRDLAGLIVIDFIDMEYFRNRKAVEKALKDALKADRARIQLGRISSFGLLEMSRQRIRPSISESQMIICPTCGGSGVIFATEPAALMAIRAAEKAASDGGIDEINLFVNPEIAMFILNRKRDMLSKIETKYNLRIIIMQKHEVSGAGFEIKKYLEGKLIEEKPEHFRKKRKDKNRGRRDRRENQSEENVVEEAEEITVEENSLEVIAEPAEEVVVKQEESQQEKPKSRGRRKVGDKKRFEQKELISNELPTKAEKPAETKSAEIVAVKPSMPAVIEKKEKAILPPPDIMPSKKKPAKKGWWRGLME